MKKLLNYLFLFLFSFYLIFIILRIFFRTPLDSLFLTGILIALPLLLWFILFIILLTFKIVKLFSKNQKPIKVSEDLTTSTSTFKDRVSKLFTHYFNLRIYLEDFIKNSFVSSFLMKSSIFSKFSLSCQLLFCSYRSDFSKILKRTFIGFWVILLILYFYEILGGNNLFLCLYLFSINLLLKTFVDIFLYLVEFENERLLKRIENNHFLTFVDFLPLNNFFKINDIIRDVLLFGIDFGEEHNKNMKIFLWNTFCELLQHLVNLKILTDFVKPDWIILKRLLQKINLIIFSTSFILLLFSKFMTISDLFIVLAIFFSSFAIFYLWLNYLTVFIDKDLVFRTFFEDSEIMGVLYQQWFEKTEKLLLQESYLTADDLQFNWFKHKNVEELHQERFADFINVLSDQEQQILKYSLLKLNNWFLDAVLAGEIDLHNFRYTPNVSSKNKTN